MLFEAIKVDDKGWALKPLSGPFDGQVVVTATGINLANVNLKTKRIIGSPRSLWNPKLLVKDLEQQDKETYQKLCANHPFSLIASNPVTVVDEGYYDEEGVLLESVGALRLSRLGVFYSGRRAGLTYTGGLPL